MVSQKPKYCKNFERNSHWRKLSMIMVWERYCNASPKPEFFLFSLFIFSFISRLIWVRLGWNFHRWFSIQKQVNWLYNWSFSLKFCTSQHSYPVPLRIHGTIPPKFPFLLLFFQALRAWPLAWPHRWPRGHHRVPSPSQTPPRPPYPSPVNRHPQTHSKVSFLHLSMCSIQIFDFPFAILFSLYMFI